MAESGKAAPKFWSMGSGTRPLTGQASATVGALLTETQNHMNAGKLSEAAQLAQQAVKIADTAITRVALAAVSLVKGDLEGAETNYLKALAHRPDHFKALLGLGQLKLNRGQGPEAVRLLQNALKSSPGNPDARHLLARAYALNGRLDQALELFEALKVEKPQAADVWLGYAHTLSALGKADPAVAAYRHALKLNPKDHRLQMLVAEGFLSVGQVDNAERHFRNALRLKPDFGPPYHQLARLKRLTDAEYEEARRQLAVLPVGNRKRAPFLAAISQMGEQKGIIEEAFAALSEALELRRQARATIYDRAAASATASAAIQEIGSGRRHSLAPASPRPLFIIGMPRSGSTLIEQILTRHPDVFAAGEWPAIQKAVGGMEKLAKPFPQGLAQLSEEEIGQLRSIYYMDLEKDASAKTLITDKQLNNFLYLPLIETLFPEARIVRCRRHPMDICWSIMTQLFGKQIPFALSADDICHHMLDQHRVFAAWSERGSLPTLEVFYEELVDRFEDGARALVDFAGLDWDDACLNPQGASRAVLTASAGQVHQSISKSSVGRWKPFAPYLLEAQEALRPLIEGHEAELARRGVTTHG
jgi:tetratricopeptide (TPR) repeat protein